MSYYTYYELNVTPRNKRSKPSDELVRSLENAIDDLHEFKTGNYKDGWSGYTSWMSDTDDMVELSSKFPDIIFEMHGDGEGSEDMWIAHFCNGRESISYAQITYDPPDMDYLLTGVRKTPS